ncbi:DUF2182 domain-containing protein [soil metagenome]
MVVISLFALSIITWIVSIHQYDSMMSSMMAVFNPISLTLFTTIWTAGMAAMMFPAIIPMVLMFNRLTIKDSNAGKSESFLMSNENNNNLNKGKKPIGFQMPSLKITLFVLSYLLVWAITGIVLLVGWSIFVDFILPHAEQFINAVNGNMSTTNTIYGILLLISGIYQFSPLKKKCLGYCESPLGFFMRRWEDGKIGAVKMGMHHGLYCLGCCWPYFLLMVALGGMNALWMGVFAAIIFAEKVWVKGGLWIARLTGIIFVILGMLTIGGFMILDNPQSMSNDMDMMAMIVLLT